MTTPAARFAAVYAALTASHECADYWGQPDFLATHKGDSGPAGAACCLAHVALYTAIQAGTTGNVTTGTQHVGNGVAVQGDVNGGINLTINESETE